MTVPTPAPAQREPDEATVERVRDAIYYLTIDNNAERKDDGNYIEPTVWWVIDTLASEPEVNWPGDLIAKCTSLEEARRVLAKEVIRQVALAGRPHHLLSRWLRRG